MTRGGRGAPGGLLAAAASRGGRGGLGRAYPYPSRPGTQPALEYDGGEEKDEPEDGKKLLNDYFTMMFENYTTAQVDRAIT